MTQVLALILVAVLGLGGVWYAISAMSWTDAQAASARDAQSRQVIRIGTPEDCDTEINLPTLNTQGVTPQANRWEEACAELQKGLSND